MTPDADNTPRPEDLADSSALADALESDRFRKFLDHIPFAVAVAELMPAERIIYANPEFQRLAGTTAASLEGKTWTALPDTITSENSGKPLGDVLVSESDYLGTFVIPGSSVELIADAWSNVIEDDSGKETYRLVALSETNNHPTNETGEDYRQQVVEKDTQLRELQHRVKNNLQMITALIRLEARNLPDKSTGDRFDTLAGRVEALALLYRSLAAEGAGDTVDLGVYVSQIASAVMTAHAVEGIHLNLQVDTWPVAVDVALPTGLVINEVLTNSLKHAFADGDGGTITLKCLVDDSGCKVLISDDGKGLPEGATWPPAGKMSTMIVQSLRENAHAAFTVESSPGKGMSVSIFFARRHAIPEAG
ncbi:MAG: histidine kinase [Devosia sp.]|uniref:sensor histidine kinase n=1 Tax=Devosia sp. TaxID=1871048 RepID=UPI002624C24C|nr:histidine kinase dimerization/phosphoacceptor domain -containing protein [Devosia sp.]MDB5541047.1 histidine kinase [Devosia sp.]